MSGCRSCLPDLHFTLLAHIGTTYQALYVCMNARWRWRGHVILTVHCILLLEGLSEHYPIGKLFFNVSVATTRE